MPQVWRPAGPIPSGVAARRVSFLRPVARGGTPRGRPLAVLCGDVERCGWPIGTRHWWPPPLRFARGLLAARWIRERCDSCRRYRVILVATREVADGADVTVDEDVVLGRLGSDFAVEATFDLSYFAVEATFDGGVREVRGRKVGGAGATLWELCPLWWRQSLRGHGGGCSPARHGLTRSGGLVRAPCLEPGEGAPRTQQASSHQWR